SNLQKIVTDNCYSSDDFNRYISNNQSSLKTMISNSLSKSIDGPGSWSVSQISRIEYSGGNVKIYFSRPSNYKYSFESYSYGSFANDVLTISSFSYYSPSPTNYFNWNGSKITGLTSAGKSQSMLAIPTSCTSIGEYAFRSANNLRTLIIPGTVKRLETAAIEKCANLSSVELKEGVTDIGSYAFGECTSLRSIYLPNSVTALRTFAFNKCTNLNTLSLDYKNSRLGLLEQQAFNACSNLTSITLPENRIEIQYRAIFITTDGAVGAILSIRTNIYIYSTSMKFYHNAFFTDSSITNYYFYGLTNPNNLVMEASPFVGQKYAYVKNNDVKNKLKPEFRDDISLL
ncbi:MAG: leucine-rich repeat domain-containing protein, partial [Ureaplasma sp.]|nr:leucine-rich repeat domain-containing protein [Ureaplasma sp.]